MRLRPHSHLGDRASMSTRHSPRAATWLLPRPQDMVLLWIILVHSLGGHFVTANCPEKCLCPATSNQVSCEGAGFSEIPRGLPPAITTLDLSSNSLMTLTSSSLSLLRNVVNMKLKGNDINRIHDGAFSPMQSLQTLDLSGNELSELSQYSFQGASTLLHLDLSGNRLSSIEGAFADMSELSRLDLANNQITKLTQFTFRDLSNLRYLLLAGNQISEIDRRVFRNLEKLMYLVLKGNPIGQVPRYQFNSLFLSYVDLSECGLTRIPRGLPSSIRYLQLRRNNMTQLHRHAFQDCPHVSILVLDENGLEEVQEKTFEHMNYLQQLWLNNNQLRIIPKPLSQSLQRLLMDSNLLANVTNVFPVASQLNTLSLMGNNISHVTYDAFSRLSQIKSMDLSNNHIQHLYGNMFLNNTELKILQLSKNPLRYFHSRCFYGLSSLRTLSLAYVGTEVSMFWDVFGEVSRLNKLDLDSSPYVIRSVFAEDRLIGSLSSVEDLSMQSSDITSLRSDFPQLFPDLLVLHISSTRWHCDTSLLWFRSWLLTTEVQVENKQDIKCFTPRAVHDRPLVELAESAYIAATTPVGGVVTTYPTARLTTFTTDRPTRTTTTSDKPSPSENTRADNNYEEESESNTFDLEDLYHDLENPDGSFPFLPNLETKSREPDIFLPPTPKEITWEEILSRTSSAASVDGLRGSPTSVPSSEGKYSVQNDNLSLQTSPKVATSLEPLPTPSSDSEGATSGTRMLIIVATTLTTVVIATILIATIVYFSRKGRKRGSSSTGASPSKTKRKKSTTSSNKSQGTYQNGIKYKHRNDVLYFMPASEQGSTTDSLQTNASGTTKEANMSLVPGRDINHEGPLRCYKWEDF